MAKKLDEFKALHDPHTKVKQLEKELKEARRESADAQLVKAAIGVLDQKINELDPPRWTLAPAKASSPGVPTLFGSDWHWGEVVEPSQIGGVNRYNSAIAKKRLRYTIETTIRLCQILSPTMDYPGIVFALGGDMQSGNIHEELQATNDLNTMDTLLDLYDNTVPAINLLANEFGHVFLPCVGGNHGRDTKKTWAKDRNFTSFDWVLYQFLARHFKNDKRVTFFIPDGPDALFRVYNWRYLLTHGDQFRGGDGIIGPLGPITRGDHKKRSRNAQVGQAYDTIMMGHFHQWMSLRRLIVNGSLKGYDEYAFVNNFGFEEPQQGLWITHPRHNLTFSAPVKCERGAAPPTEQSWVEIAP